MAWRVHYVFGFLLIVLLLVSVCAEVSVVLNYMHLSTEDWQWRWKVFFASGSVGLFKLSCSTSYSVFQLRSFSGPVLSIMVCTLAVHWLWLILFHLLAPYIIRFLSKMCCINENNVSCLCFESNPQAL
ncbi:unnamed protein product [Musa hybrid cultivar]